MELQRSSDVEAEVFSSYIDIKQQLAALPVTPSYLVATPSIHESTIGESAPSITTTTTRTDTNYSKSTAATSVLTIPSTFRFQSYYYCPIDMQVENEVSEVWTTLIQHRLNGILLQEIPTGTCVQELMMVGKKSTALRPTVIISCGDAKTKKKVEKVFKTLGWLQVILKAKNMTFMTLNTKTRLSGSEQPAQGEFQSHNQKYAIQIFEPAVTLCGQPIVIAAPNGKTEMRCTFGGVLLIDELPYGLSAAHPFRDYLRNSKTEDGGASHDNPSSLEDKKSDLGSDDDEEGDDDDDNPFCFNAVEDDDTDLVKPDELVSQRRLSTSTSSIDSPNEDFDATNSTIDCDTSLIANHETPDEPWSASESTGIIVSLAEMPSLGSEGQGSAISTDWAVFVLSDQSVIKPNIISHRDSRHDIHVNQFHQGIAKGQVVVLVGGIGVQMGQLHASPATLKVDRVCYNVQLITLEQVLPLGSSGSWVVIDDKLCGFIIATRPDVPWAYMMPIGPVLQDMKGSLGTDNIRLPQRSDLAPAINHDVSTLPFVPRNKQRRSSLVQGGHVTDADPRYDPNKGSNAAGLNRPASYEAPEGTTFGKIVPKSEFSAITRILYMSESRSSQMTQLSTGPSPLLQHLLDSKSTLTSSHNGSSLYSNATANTRHVASAHVVPTLYDQIDITDDYSDRSQPNRRLTSDLIRNETQENPSKRQYLHTRHDEESGQASYSIIPAPSTTQHSWDDLLPVMTYRRDYDGARTGGWQIPFERQILRSAYRHRRHSGYLQLYLRWRDDVVSIFKPLFSDLSFPSLYTRPETTFRQVLQGSANVLMIVMYPLFLVCYPFLLVSTRLAQNLFYTLKFVLSVVFLTPYFCCRGICYAWVVNKHQLVLNSLETHELQLRESIQMLGDAYDGYEPPMV